MERNKRKERDCFWLWCRRKFIIVKRESMARGRDTWESPEWT